MTPAERLMAAQAIGGVRGLATALDQLAESFRELTKKVTRLNRMWAWERRRARNHRAFERMQRRLDAVRARRAEAEGGRP